MALTQLTNGMSGANCRTNINAAITGLNNASGPNVIYVTTAGNDTTGDGTLAKPYRLALKAIDVANTAFLADGTTTLIEFGVGNFGECNISILTGVTMRGCGHTKTFFDSATSNGGTGSTGDNGGNGGNIYLDAPGICVLGNISATGGDAGTGYPEAQAGSGGAGGTITLKGVKFNGDIICTGGNGGAAGTDGSVGIGGAGGTITLYDCVTDASGNLLFAGGSGSPAGANGSVKAFRSQLKMSFPSSDISLIDCITADNGSATAYGGAVFPAL